MAKILGTNFTDKNFGEILRTGMQVINEIDPTLEDTQLMLDFDNVMDLVYQAAAGTFTRASMEHLNEVDGEATDEMALTARRVRVSQHVTRVINTSNRTFTTYCAITSLLIGMYLAASHRDRLPVLGSEDTALDEALKNFFQRYEGQNNDETNGG